MIVIGLVSGTKWKYPRIPAEVCGDHLESNNYTWNQAYLIAAAKAMNERIVGSHLTPPDQESSLKQVVCVCFRISHGAPTSFASGTLFEFSAEILFSQLGAGTGALGIAAAALGARVTLTDLAAVVPLTTQNVKLNSGTLARGGSAVVVRALLPSARLWMLSHGRATNCSCPSVGSSLSEKRRFARPKPKTWQSALEACVGSLCWLC